MMSRNSDKAVICGFTISTDGLDANFSKIAHHIRTQKGVWVVTLNLEMIYRAEKFKEYRALLSGADLFVADGVPLIWASQIKRGTKKIAGRTNGTDLVEKLLASGNRFRVGVIGGTNPANAVKKINPSLLDNAYFYDGIVELNDKHNTEHLIYELKKNKINLLFLCLGIPKQDKLAWRIRREIDAITIIGVGGAFDLLSGQKPRAPIWMQKNGLEWLFRLITEPKRLAKRYLIHYPQALYFLIRNII